MTDIDKYLSFVLNIFVAFGIAFQVPIAVVVLVKLSLVTTAKLREIRLCGCWHDFYSARCGVTAYARHAIVVVV